jgi:hypothetical protein
MKTLIGVLLMTVTTSLFALDPISIDGKNFVNAKGETVIFRGMNTADPDKLEKEEMWSDILFKEIADWGSNIIRFPVHPRAWRERGVEKYLELLDAGIELANKHNMHVIIDWHSIGNLGQEKFQNPMYDTTIDETIEFWRTMAKRYKDEPAVAMYEIYNEPTVTGDRFGDMSWPEWKALQEKIIKEIRAIDDKKIVLCAGFNWAYDLTVVKDAPIDDKFVAYVSHPYPQKRQRPWEEQWEADWGFAADTYPVILTEIGFCLEDERGAHMPVIDDGAYGKAITDYTEKKGISWVGWVFDTSWSPMMVWDWDFTPTTQGAFFKAYLQSKK